MADRNLTIIAKVVDSASSKLRTVQGSLGGFGGAVKKADQDVTKFNRTLFSLTAFIGTFERAFRGLGNSMVEGAGFQRVNDQFEALFGSRGQFSQLIDGFTDNFVDQFEAMKAGTDLKRLGIIDNVDQLAELMARAGTAAKLANKTSAEGIQEVAGFLKDGSVAHLEFLDVVARTNPALKAQLTILKATGGVLGGVISQQQALRIGMNLLRGATDGSMKGFRDMLDQILSLQQAFTFFKKSIGSFIATAGAPLISFLKPVLLQLTSFLDNVRKNDKNLMFLARSVMFVSGALATMLATLGSIRLIGISLTSLGIGIPALTAVIIGLGAGFLGLTHNVDSFVDKLKLFSGFFRGVFQLVHSFLSDPENFAKGIGKMDKSLYDLLKRNGLLELATTIARLSAVSIRFISDVGQKLIDWARTLDNVISKLLNVFFKLFGSDTHKGWGRGMIDSTNKVRNAIVTITAALIGAFGAFKLFKGLGSIFQNIPIIGKVFGGAAPKGTKSDPIYVVGAGLGGGLDFSDVLSGGKGKGLLAGLGGLASRAGGMYLGAAAIGGASNLIDKFQDPDFETKFADRVGGYSNMDFLMHPGDAITAISLGLREKIFGGGLEGVPQKTSTVIPQMPDSQLDAVDQLGEKMKEMQGARRQEFEGMIENALSPSSLGGSNVTKEEWAQLMTYAMRKALDTSQSLNKLSTSKNGDSNDVGYRR